MSDVGEHNSNTYSDFIKALNELIGNKSFKAFISLRYSSKILNELWNKYIKNGIPIPDNVLYKHYPKDTRNHRNAREKILEAESSINTQRRHLTDFVNDLYNDLYKQRGTNTIFKSNDKNTITHNGGAFLNKGKNYSNINNWKNKLLCFKGGSNYVIRPYDKKNQSVLLCFADVDRYFRDVKSGIEVAKTLTNRGIILVFLGNHLIINKNDITNESKRYSIFSYCLKIAQDASKEKSDKMLQKNEAKRRRQKRKSPSVSHDDVNMLHHKKCSEETHSSDVSDIHKKQRNNTDECLIFREDFPKNRSPDYICNNCGKCIINHKKKDLFSISSFFGKYLKL